MISLTCGIINKKKKKTNNYKKKNKLIDDTENRLVVHTGRKYWVESLL